MKKYIKPIMKVAILEEESIIATSGGGVGTGGKLGNAYNNTDVSYVKGIFGSDNSGDITSSNAWDDEEDW